MQPQFLQGGSLVLQLSPADKVDPYHCLKTWQQTLTQWAQLTGTVVNTNLAISAPTAGRPTSASLALLPGGGIGYSLFDTTLGIPIWWNGFYWVNASGISV